MYPSSATYITVIVALVLLAGFIFRNRRHSALLKRLDFWWTAIFFIGFFAQDAVTNWNQVQRPIDTAWWGIGLLVAFVAWSVYRMKKQFQASWTEALISAPWFGSRMVHPKDERESFLVLRATQWSLAIAIVLLVLAGLVLTYLPTPRTMTPMVDVMLVVASIIVALRNIFIRRTGVEV